MSTVFRSSYGKKIDGGAILPYNGGNRCCKWGVKMRQSVETILAKWKGIKKIRVVFCFLGVLLLLNAVLFTAVSNLHTGVFLTYALGLLFLLAGVFHPVLPKWIRILFYAGVCLAAVFVGALLLYGNLDTATYDEDVVLILGAGIRGEALNPHLQNRLDAALAYYGQNPDAVFVVSGGQGNGEGIPESLAMERYLLAKGIPAERILQENQATSTKENIRYAKELLDGYLDAPYRVTIITSDYHVYRATRIAKETGWDRVTHCGGATPLVLLLPNGLRECLAVVEQWLFS